MARVPSPLLPVLRFVTNPEYLAAFLLTVCCAAAAIAATSEIHDPDVWWVAAAGRETLRSLDAPRQNLFSFIDGERPWIMHEWLLGPAYALGLTALGPSFFVLLALALLGVGLAIVLQGTVARTRRRTVGLALAFIAIALFGARLISARPTGVALFFPILLAVTAFAPRFSRGHAVLAVLVEVLWANSHGSFPLGVVLLLLSAAERRRDRSRRLAASAVAALSTIVNPYGARLHSFVWNYLVGTSDIYKEIHREVVEFRSVFGAWGRTTGVPDLLGLVLMGGLAIWAIARGGAYRLRGAFCVLLVVGGVLQARHVELAGLLTCLLLAPFLDRRAAAWKLPRPRVLSNAALRGGIVGGALVFGFGAFALRGHPQQPGGYIRAGQPFLDALDATAPGANLYVPFGDAGAAIWYGFPRGIRVFYDSRNDCYSPQTFRRFLALSRATTADAERRRLLNETATNAVVTPPRHPLVRALTAEPGWSITYRDARWVALRREPVSDPL